MVVITKWAFLKSSPKSDGLERTIRNHGSPPGPLICASPHPQNLLRSSKSRARGNVTEVMAPGGRFAYANALLKVWAKEQSSRCCWATAARRAAAAALSASRCDGRRGACMWVSGGSRDCLARAWPAGLGPLGWARWVGPAGLGPLGWARWLGLAGLGPLGWARWAGPAGLEAHLPLALAGDCQQRADKGRADGRLERRVECWRREEGAVVALVQQGLEVRSYRRRTAGHIGLVVDVVVDEVHRVLREGAAGPL